MKKKVAFIIGVSGQDGSYLAHYLIKKNFKVFGFTRSTTKINLKNLYKLKVLNKINLIKYSELKNESIEKKILQLRPSQIYVLSGLSSVGKSFFLPIDAYRSNISTLFKILEICRKKKLPIKIYNSTSTDCFGDNKKICNEKTPFSPLSPYAKSKSFAYWMVKYYRENFNVSCVSGIVSNHESILRPENFAIKKVIYYAMNFNSKKKLIMGNANVYRDWGWAPDFIEAIFKINNSKKRDDYVVATGKSVSLNYIIKKIFSINNIDNKFFITNNNKYKRAHEIKKVFCDNKKIKKNLGWKPKHNVNDMIIKLLNNELF